jgi:hypothetical protein
MNDLTAVVDRLQENNLRHNWPLMKPATKLRVLNQFGVSADSVDAMQHALDELLAEFGGSLVMHILLHPDLTVIEALEEVA